MDKAAEFATDYTKGHRAMSAIKATATAIPSLVLPGTV